MWVQWMLRARLIEARKLDTGNAIKKLTALCSGTRYAAAGRSTA